MKRTVNAGGVRIEYTLIRAVRRDVLIQALEGQPVRVYAPRTAHLADIDRLVRDNAEKIEAMRQALRPAPLRDGDTVRVEGTPRRVSVLPGPRDVVLTEDELRITLPDPEDADAARALARSYLSALALRRIRERIAYFHPGIGGEFGRVTVRNQRSRWGSCSSKHNLNFNWRLILAPPGCLDYVVVHELCHLREFNHSPRFWSMVEKHVRDYRVWKDYLRKNAAGLNF